MYAPGVMLDKQAAVDCSAVSKDGAAAHCVRAVLCVYDLKCKYSLEWRQVSSVKLQDSR